MLSIRKANERGHFDHGWLKTSHTFSFSDYYDPKFMGFGPLRVINEDFIEAGAGFPTHGHRNMEIVTYVVSGAVAHKDSTGSEGVIHPGELQKMTAGSGIRHSEFNHYKDQETHLYQIWLFPEQKGITPSYEQKRFAEEERHNRLAGRPGGSSLTFRGASDIAGFSLCIEIHNTLPEKGRPFAGRRALSPSTDVVL